MSNIKSAAAKFRIWQQGWQQQLIADPKIYVSDLKVGMILSFHLNTEQRKAWPSIGKILISQTGLARNTVMRSIRRLERAGHMEVERQKNRNNQYTPLALPSAKLVGLPSAKLVGPGGAKLVGPDSLNNALNDSLNDSPNHCKNSAPTALARSGFTIEQGASDSDVPFSVEPSIKAQCFALTRQKFPGEEGIVGKYLAQSTVSAEEVYEAIQDASEDDLLAQVLFHLDPDLYMKLNETEHSKIYPMKRKKR